MGIRSSRSSKVQLGHGITSALATWRNFAGAARFFSSPLEQPFASLVIHNSKNNTQAILACLHTRTNECTHSTSACFHALVRLCHGHKQRAETSCGTCIHASSECG